MDAAAAAVCQFITDSFEGVETVSAGENRFFFVGAERKLPFATLVTGDDYDQVSNLARAGVFRLNIGISKASFVDLLGPQPSAPGHVGVIESGHDFAALDELMPHPVYGHMSWVCVLNPGPATWETTQELLREAHANAVRKQAPHDR